jgi:hypothetical protein
MNGADVVSREQTIADGLVLVLGAVGKLGGDAPKMITRLELAVG